MDNERFVSFIDTETKSFKLFLELRDLIPLVTDYLLINAQKISQAPAGTSVGELSLSSMIKFYLESLSSNNAVCGGICLKSLKGHHYVDRLFKVGHPNCLCTVGNVRGNLDISVTLMFNTA